MPNRFMTKLIACLILSLLLAGTVLLIGVPPRPSWLSDKTIFAAAIIAFLVPLISLPWAKPHQMRNGISYLTGFGIATFGWKKLMHMQFRVPLSFADRPASQLDGETLTWFYFGHSFTFACIVGILQITGSALLLFRRTRLAGAILLFPVMLNILLINIFYQMNPGALLQSVTLTTGVVYIIAIHAPQLIQILLPQKDRTTIKPAPHQWIIAAIAAALPFLFVNRLSTQLPGQSPIYGRYTVEELKINGVPVNSIGKDSALTKVYFDLDNVCVLEYNDPQRRLIASYDLTRQIDAIAIKAEFTDNYHPLPLNAVVTAEGDHRLSLRGQLAGDRIAMTIRKTNDN